MFLHFKVFVMLTFVFSFGIHATEPQGSGQTKTAVDVDKVTETPGVAPTMDSKSAEKVHDLPTPPSENDSILMTSRDLRGQRVHNIFGVYSLLDTWLPSKMGLSYAYNPSSRGAWELEYLSGSYAPLGIKELGEFSETRISLLYRSFSDRNSFNFIYGLNYNSFKLGIGDKLLSTITGGIVPGYDLVTVETLGLSWGMGNRWHLNNKLMLSFDWFAIHVPVYVIESEAPFLEATTSEDDKDDIRDALDFIENIPTFSVVKIQFGYSF